MHITEGVLSGPVLAAGALAAAGGIWMGLRAMRVEHTPRVAMLSAAFFTVSLIHIPIGPAAAHLVLNGLAGIMLGWMAFPALAVALLLQAIMFQFGGLTVLGVNLVVMALPAVIAHYLFRMLWSPGRKGGYLFGMAAGLGMLAIAVSTGLQAAALGCSGRPLLKLAAVLAVTHIPVALADGFVTGAALVFLAKLRPDLLRFDKPYTR